MPASVCAVARQLHDIAQTAPAMLCTAAPPLHVAWPSTCLQDCDGRAARLGLLAVGQVCKADGDARRLRHAICCLRVHGCCCLLWRRLQVRGEAGDASWRRQTERRPPDRWAVGGGPDYTSRQPPLHARRMPCQLPNAPKELHCRSRSPAGQERAKCARCAAGRRNRGFSMLLLANAINHEMPIAI